MNSFITLHLFFYHLAFISNTYIGLTGNALDDDILAFMNAGADLVLPKPLRADVLQALIQYASQYGFLSDSNIALKVVDNSIARFRKSTL